MKKIGFIVNPVAGIGGRVGLKGSDGRTTLQKAIKLGAVPESGKKAKLALSELAPLSDAFSLITCPGTMGANICGALDLKYELTPPCSSPPNAQDTILAARYMKNAGASCILFAGGDGTARNMLDAVGTEVPVIGIPAGCKIHSAVYAINPRSAGRIAADFARGRGVSERSAEVMDIDEELFRKGIVDAKLYGYMRILTEKDLTQNLKSGRGVSEREAVEGAAQYICDEMEHGVLYIVGSGSTMLAVTDTLGEKGTLLGVDLVLNGKIIAADVAEREILRALDEYQRAKIIVTIIGGQGFIFGRGNQQLSAEVLARVGKENIIIAAAKQKLLALLGRSLLIDTGDDAVNQSLCGYYRVISGYKEISLFPAKC